MLLVFQKRIVLSSFLPIVVRTVKSDEYDRYLADVFVGGKYINAELLRQGFATRVPE